jgi:hypothetical protein
MKIIQISLADLIKKSAKHICYLRQNQKQYNTNDTHKYTINESLKKYYNMRGTYEALVKVVQGNSIEEVQFNINYVFDTIEVNDLSVLFIEQKNITGAIEPWYKQSCLVQAATYLAFAKGNKNNMLQTAKYAMDSGEPALKLTLGNKFLRSELRLGKREQYFIYMSDPDKIIQYYIEKALHTFNYNDATKWDDKHKHKDFDFLHNSITYRDKYEKRRA